MQGCVPSWLWCLQPLQVLVCQGLGVTHLAPCP